jgi:TonB family protein
MTLVMITKKLFLITIIISLAGHVVLLGVTGLIDRGNRASTDAFATFNLTENTPLREKTSVTTGVSLSTPSETYRNTALPLNENTVSLDTQDSPYDHYVVRVKERISNHWSYPDEAYRINADGTAIIRFSIDRSGVLAGAQVIDSSGNTFLDNASIQAVLSAAPFEPLPEDFNLTRLHIVARFQYTFTEG